MPEDLAPTMIDVGTPPDDRRIAVRARPATGSDKGPGLFWLGGFKSDMRGTKAEALDHWAAGHGRACVRFDYSGHGESGGNFTDGTIGRWADESLAVFDRLCEGPQVVVGSSMGGWIALLLAQNSARMIRSGPVDKIMRQTNHEACGSCPHRAGAGLHRRIDVEGDDAGQSARRSSATASGCGRRPMAKNPIRSQRS